MISVISLLLVAAVAVGNWATAAYATSLNALFTVTQGVSVNSTKDQWRKLAMDVAKEGMVLLKNEDNTLPLITEAGTNKVNLIGYNAYNPYYSGSGSGEVSAADSISIVQSLEDAGFEVNPAIADEEIYKVEDAEDASVGWGQVTLSIDEVSADDYKGDASFEKMSSYSDTAVVVLGRTGGENFDLTSYEDGDYLEINDNEKSLLQAARDYFDKVIVVINSANPIELGFLDEYDIDACIWAGEPGVYGFEALGGILNGEVNPSGRLSDTWIYDNDSNIANENYTDQKADNFDIYYVDYVENIYVGYKWYETAYTENAKITNKKSEKTFDYGDFYSVVMYPFGYGLSYTTFDQEIIGSSSENTAIDPNGEVVISVDVTNTGHVAGKEVVQLYVTVPYTDYDRQNNVEKAAVSLCAYGKTEELEPGESETVELTVKLEDIASYDSTHDNGDGSFGSYMLDAGEYVFSARSDSHNTYGEVRGTLSEQHFYAGEDKRSSDDQAAYNQFDDAARGVYLSRQDSFENYDEAMDSVATSIVSTKYEENPNEYDLAYDDVVTKEYKEGVDYAAKGDLTLADMKGLDYENTLWDKLISQLSLDELKSLILDATYASPEIKGIDKGATTDSDGPLGIKSMYNTALNGVGYPCEPLVAATFNDELVELIGEYVADQAHQLGMTGWYAPAMNTHRSQYSGRNFEYYSEDAFLAGSIARSVVAGGRKNGLAVYIKHFVLNEMDTNRSDLCTYSNEQAIREIYMKPFEMSVKDGGANALMTSMNSIGDVYVGASQALLTEVLRNEWGFRGATLTDMANDQDAAYIGIDHALRAGTDSLLLVGGVPKISAKSNADIYYLQRAAHNLLFVEANSVTVSSEIGNYGLYFGILYVELIALAIICIAAIMLRNKKRNVTEKM